MKLKTNDYKELKSGILKWSLAAVIVLLALAGTKQAYGQTDGEFNLDFNLPKGFDVEIRDREETNHFEIGKEFSLMGRELELEYRFADLDVAKEHRLNLDIPVWHTMFLTGHLTTAATVEYRKFESNDMDTSWRTGTKIRWDKPLMRGPTGGIDFFWEIHPRVSFMNDRDLYTSRDKLGVRFTSDADFFIEPFVERTHIDDYDRAINIYGVNFQLEV